jgi:hypothetical protein
MSSACHPPYAATAAAFVEKEQRRPTRPLVVEAVA